MGFIQKMWYSSLFSLKARQDMLTVNKRNKLGMGGKETEKDFFKK